MKKDTYRINRNGDSQTRVTVPTDTFTPYSVFDDGNKTNPDVWSNRDIIRSNEKLPRRNEPLI